VPSGGAQNSEAVQCGVYRLVDTVIRGAQVGSVYGLVGLGLSIVYTATGVFNFSHGDLVMLGALLGLLLWHRLAVTFLLTAAAVMAVTCAVGATTEVVAVRGVARTRQSSVSWVISTLAVSILIEAVTPFFLHAGAFPPYVRWHPFLIGQELIIPQRLVLIPIAVGVTGVLALWSSRTLWGRAMAAMASDREGAAMRGIPVGRFSIGAFALGGTIAGLAGLVAGPITQASFVVAIPSTLQGFVAATLGGITCVWGPVVGGIVLGLTLQFTTVYWDPAFANVVELGLLLLVLVTRPEGLLGRRFRAV
jgi:branched-chain amino acid transport system permease protein